MLGPGRPLRTLRALGTTGLIAALGPGGLAGTSTAFALPSRLRTAGLIVTAASATSGLIPSLCFVQMLIEPGQSFGHKFLHLGCRKADESSLHVLQGVGRLSALLADGR